MPERLVRTRTQKIPDDVYTPCRVGTRAWDLSQFRRRSSEDRHPSPISELVSFYYPARDPCPVAVASRSASAVGHATVPPMVPESWCRESAVEILRHGRRR